MLAFKLTATNTSIVNTVNASAIQTSGQSQWSKEACRKHLAAGLYFREANSARPERPGQRRTVGERVGNNNDAVITEKPQVWWHHHQQRLLSP